MIPYDGHFNQWVVQIYRRHLEILIFHQLVDSYPTVVKYKAAYSSCKNSHHLAGKASKSCYKLREDRVAHHL